MIDHKAFYDLDRACPQTEFVGLRCFKPLVLALRLHASQQGVDTSRLMRRLLVKGLQAEGISVPGFPKT